jgi:hypothetical protein
MCEGIEDDRMDYNPLLRHGKTGAPVAGYILTGLTP